MRDKCRSITGKCRQGLLNHLHGTLALWSKRYKKRVLESKGFMTKKGQIIDYEEWHAASFAVALVSLAYLLHPVFIVFTVWLLHRVMTSDEAEVNQIKYEIQEQTHYFVGFVLATVIFFKYVMGMSLGLETGDMSMILSALELLG